MRAFLITVYRPPRSRPLSPHLKLLYIYDADDDF